MSQPEPVEIVVPERRVPAPETISPEARATLGIGPAAAILFAQAEPDPADIAGWKRLVANREDMAGPLLRQNADRHPCKLAVHPVGEAQLFEMNPDSVAEEMRGCAILYLHPGGFIMGAGINGAYMGMPLADRLAIPTYALDYRMAPDHPFPAGLDDCVAAYRWLMERTAPERILIAGRSAGGGLAPGLLLRLRDLGLPMPAGCILQTPAVDLTGAGDSCVTNLGIDNFLRPIPNAMRLYAGGTDPRDPYLSPVFADCTGFPPTLLTSGTRDLLLSATVLMHRALRRAGVEAELHVWEAMGHGGFFGFAPEDEEVWDELRRFSRRCLAISA